MKTFAGFNPKIRLPRSAQHKVWTHRLMMRDSYGFVWNIPKATPELQRIHLSKETRPPAFDRWLKGLFITSYLPSQMWLTHLNVQFVWYWQSTFLHNIFFNYFKCLQQLIILSIKLKIGLDLEQQNQLVLKNSLSLWAQFYQAFQWQNEKGDQSSPLSLL